MTAESRWTNREDAQDDALLIVRDAQLSTRDGWQAAVKALASHAEERKVLEDEAGGPAVTIEQARHDGALEAWNDAANLLWHLYNNGTVVRGS